jgi:uncharacterized membrane protein
MYLSFLAILLEFSRTAASMSAAGIVLFVIGAFAATRAVADSRGLEKVVALSNLLFAMPLAAFGGEHFAAANGISRIVPSFVPWHLFWTYLVGVALVAASLSIATKIQVQWSGLLFGIMMFLFVAMMDLPGTLQDPHNRISWTLLFRELSFGCGGFCLAALAMEGGRAKGKSQLVTVARVIIGLAAILYGVEHFLHPTNVPGVPLEKFMPTWIPAPAPIAYITGAILLVCGIGILLAKKTRLLATYLGTWITLLVVFIYGPILISSLLDPSTDTKVEGLNYFFDTMLFAGTILALAGASPPSE